MFMFKSKFPDFICLQLLIAQVLHMKKQYVTLSMSIFCLTMSQLVNTTYKIFLSVKRVSTLFQPSLVPWVTYQRGFTVYKLSTEAFSISNTMHMVHRVLCG